MSVSNKRIHNEYLEMWIDDYFIYTVYLPNTIVDLKAAKIIYTDRIKLHNGMPYPCYVDAREVKYWTKEARAFQSTVEHNFQVKAFAVHFKSEFQKTILNFYLFFNKPKTPTKGFTSKDEALEWLKNYK